MYAKRFSQRKKDYCGAGMLVRVGAALMAPVGTPLPFQGRGRGGVLTALNVMSVLRFSQR